MHHLEPLSTIKCIEKGLINDQNVASLLDFKKARGNPFIICSQNIKLQNIFTNQVVEESIRGRIFNVFENGETA